MPERRGLNAIRRSARGPRSSTSHRRELLVAWTGPAADTGWGAKVRGTWSDDRGRAGRGGERRSSSTARLGQAADVAARTSDAAPARHRCDPADAGAARSHRPRFHLLHHRDRIGDSRWDGPRLRRSGNGAFCLGASDFDTLRLPAPRRAGRPTALLTRDTGGLMQRSAWRLPGLIEQEQRCRRGFSVARGAKRRSLRRLLRTPLTEPLGGRR
jgi:hypothetical protein